MTLHRIEDRIDGTANILKERPPFPELGLKTMPKLDNILWGIKRKQITLVAARTSIGKSSWVLQVAYDLALQGKKIMFLSLEMDIESLVERLFCNDQEIDNERLMKGEFKKYGVQWDRFKKKFDATHFVVSDICGKNWREVDEILNNLEVKPDVIVIDHINHIKSPHGKDKEMIDDYIINMQAMAIQHNIAIIIVAQINRTALDSKDPVPQMHQLKGTGCLEEIAPTIILLHWEYKYNQTKDKNIYKVIIAKNRNGRTGYIDIKFEPEYYRFSNMMEHKKEEKIIPPTKYLVEQKEINWTD